MQKYLSSSNKHVNLYHLTLVTHTPKVTNKTLYLMWVSFYLKWV